MRFTYFIGIDIAKKTIAAAIYISASQPLLYWQFDNRPSGFKELLAWVTRHCGKQDMLFCFEHTGIYALPLCCFFTQEKLAYSQQSALQVKKSMGIQPHWRTGGKSDKAGAAPPTRKCWLDTPTYIEKRYNSLNYPVKQCLKFST